MKNFIIIISVLVGIAVLVYSAYLLYLTKEVKKEGKEHQLPPREYRAQSYEVLKQGKGDRRGFGRHRQRRDVEEIETNSIEGTYTMEKLAM